ncbi:MAG TPA: diaminopropionate ammonia-lyase [Geminicoccaceae bacterium]
MLERDQGASAQPMNDLIPAACRPGEARFLLNPRASDAAVPGPALEDVLGPAGFERARTVITGWPGYAPTPLRSLPGLASAIGIAALGYKDEGGRFGLASFKALGGAYAVAELVRERGAGLTVTCATDGNHGRSVAWGARTFGARAVIYIHATVSEGRKRAIEAYGAEVRRVPGNYDDSVRQAAEDAARHGWTVVSDTSYPGYTEIPKLVMQGYGVMAAEAIDQIAAPPSHVFVQGGVGGLAAAVAMHLWWRYGRDRPRLVVVEPETAACLLASCEAGRPAAVAGDLETVMAGLSCGEPSLLAWTVLERAAHAFMTVPDHAAEAVMRLLAEPTGDDPPVVAGESAVAGLAGAIAAVAVPEVAARLALDRSSRVLVFGTEGATDPDLYRRIVGRTPEAVEARQQ